jgi:hypothetical protein
MMDELSHIRNQIATRCEQLKKERDDERKLLLVEIIQHLILERIAIKKLNK